MSFHLQNVCFNTILTLIFTILLSIHIGSSQLLMLLDPNSLWKLWSTVIYVQKDRKCNDCDWLNGEREPWAISSCLRVSPTAENRSSLMRVSALRLHSRCWAFSCMADRVDSSMSVSFSTRWYFPKAWVHTTHQSMRKHLRIHHMTDFLVALDSQVFLVFFFLMFSLSSCTSVEAFTLGEPKRPQRKQVRHTDDELASHSKNMRAAYFCRDTQRYGFFLCSRWF